MHPRKFSLRKIYAYDTQKDTQLLPMPPLSVSRLHNLVKAGRSLHNKFLNKKGAEIVTEYIVSAAANILNV